MYTYNILIISKGKLANFKVKFDRQILIALIFQYFFQKSCEIKVGTFSKLLLLYMLDIRKKIMKYLI